MEELVEGIEELQDPSPCLPDELESSALNSPHWKLHWVWDFYSNKVVN